MIKRDQHRPYRSTLRNEQAASTRLRVVAAARDLFATQGYARTTLGAIALAAGVSVETVQAQGPKRSLLTAAFRLASYGLDTPARLLDADDGRPLVEATTLSEVAGAAARLMTRENSRTPGIWRAFSSAAADDAAVDGEWAEVMAGVRSTVVEVVRMVEDKGLLRADMSVEDIAASAWILVSPETYEKLTLRLGWTLEHYEAWLGRALFDVMAGPVVYADDRAHAAMTEAAANTSAGMG